MAKVFPGLAQKIAPVFIALTAIAWFLVVVGFGVGSQKVEEVKDGEEPLDAFAFPKGPNDRAEPESYPFWIVCFSGVAAVVFALLHAALWRPFSIIFGAITAFLTVFFVSGLGMILYENGDTIRGANDNDVDVPSWFALEFAGAFLAILFWTPVMILWFFYDIEVSFSLRKS